jgi:hypothetical protein
LPSSPDSLWPAVASGDDFVGTDVIALLSRADFERGRGSISDLLRWRDFDDFISERDGEFLALSSAGVAVSQQRAPLVAFNRWARLTGRERTLAALDDFATRRRICQIHPDWAVRGALISGDAVGFAERQSKAGTLLIPIAQNAYTKWDRSVSILKLFRNPNSIDQYAALIAEICLARRSKRRRN